MAIRLPTTHTRGTPAIQTHKGPIPRKTVKVGGKTFTQGLYETDAAWASRSAQLMRKYGVAAPVGAAPVDQGQGATGGGRRSRRFTFRGSIFGRPSFSSRVQAAEDAANWANRARLSRIMGLYAGMGGAERQRIGRGARRQQSAVSQSLINRGLSSSTVLGPMMTRIQETAQRGYLDVADRVRGRMAGVLERVSDVGPDMNLVTRMQRLHGRYGNTVN